MDHKGAVTGVAISRDGSMIISGSSGKVKVIAWDISSDLLRARACAVAGRNLTDDEWRRHVRYGEPQLTCPNPLIKQALVQAHNREKPGAEATFARVVDWAIQLKDPVLNNQICWHGALEGFASVVMRACERAVDTSPSFIAGQVHDSRGVARALVGERAGAVADFELFVEWAERMNVPEISKEMIDKRRRWIEALNRGEDPFDAVTLRALRFE
jgi:hypothetical protein